MGCNKDEAARAKALAERKLLDKDFVGAKKLIIKAQQFSKEVGDIDIPKMLTVCDVHCAAGAKENGQIDWYGILQVPETADDEQIKKQYHKLALLLHPDKNKFGGAEAAFKLVGEANDTLTDMSKRSLYDMKRVRATERTFWTMCPSCGTRYQYYISALEKALCCLNQNCLKQFIACDLTEQAVPYKAKQPSARAVVDSSESSKSETSSDNEEERVVVESSESNISETSSDNEEEGAVVESSESSISEASSDSEEEISDHGPAVNGSAQGQRNRQMQEVMYNEEKVDDDFVNSPRLKRLRKSGMFCGNDNKKTTKLVEEIAGHDGMTDGANTCSTTEDEREGCASMHGVELDTDDASDVVPQGDTLRFSHCVPHHVVGGTEKEGILEKSLELDPAALFLDLEEDFPSIAQEVVSIMHGTAVHDLMEQAVPSGANQQYAGVWKNAGVPQKSPGPRANVTAEVEAAWSFSGLPVSCGCFKYGKSDTSKETGMFSRTISYEKSKTRNCFEIYPREGEVWALFKGWDIGWSSDPDNHKYWSHQYEVVQVLSDLTMSTSINVMPLVKIKGYDNLFMQSREAAPYVIPQGDTLRFSHCIPHHVMSAIGEKVPEGSLELDPAALPLYMVETFPCETSECRSVSEDHGDRYAGSSSGNSSNKGSMNVGEGQHTPSMNAGIAAETPKEDNSKHNTCPAEVSDVDEDNIFQIEYVCAESEFYDFSQIRLLQKFSPGQIWALYSTVHVFPNYYGFIQNVDLKNGKVQVRWLDVCPRGEEEKRLLQEEWTIGCGTFRLSTVHKLMTYNDTDAFSHCVEARSTGQKGEYEIMPHLGEIWAVYKDWRAGWTAQDFGRCGFELVEILGQTASSIRVQLLRKVDGYRLVYMPYGGEGSVKTIWRNEYPKFSHQIPYFRLTREKGGKLQGCLELDPLSLPEEFLNCR